jgi:hypothetical protein
MTTSDNRLPRVWPSGGHTRPITRRLTSYVGIYIPLLGGNYKNDMLILFRLSLSTTCSLDIVSIDDGYKAHLEQSSCTPHAADPKKRAIPPRDRM